MSTALYNCRSTGAAHYVLTKFDADLNVESSYQTTEKECACPAGAKPTCRHRTMLPLFITSGHIDDGWFLDWSTRMWRKPLTFENGGCADDRELGQGQPATDVTNRELGTVTATEIAQRRAELDERFKQETEKVLEPIISKITEITNNHLGAAPLSNASEAVPEAPAPASSPTTEARPPAAPEVVQRAGALPRRRFTA